MQTFREAGRALTQQGVWCSRNLWGRIQQTMESNLEELSSLRLARAQASAASAAAAEEQAVARLMEEHTLAERARHLEVQASALSGATPLPFKAAVAAGTT